MCSYKSAADAALCSRACWVCGLQVAAAVPAVRTSHALSFAAPPAPRQVLVYFAVAKKGDAPTDGKTDVNPEGLTAAYGPHAAAVAARLHAAGLSCKVRWEAWCADLRHCSTKLIGCSLLSNPCKGAGPAALHVQRARCLISMQRCNAAVTPCAGAEPAGLHVQHAGEADLDLRLYAGGRTARRLHRGRGGGAGKLGGQG